MAGVLTAALARGARHSLGVTGLALLVAGAVAFLPLSPTGSAAGSRDDSTLAAATSIEAMRNVFATAAEAAADAEPTPAVSTLAAVAPPTLEESAGPGAIPTSTAIETVGQAIISSALQQATAAAARTPEPAPVATAVARAAVSLPSIEAALAESPWPRELWPTVERIILCESSGNPGAVSPSGYMGLMQVAPWLHGAVPADAVGQLTQAYGVYLRQGWGAWGCY